MVIQLAGPERTPLECTSFIVLQSDHTYTSTAVVSSFGRNNSGSYECTANITSTTPTTFLIEQNSSKSVQITTGKPLYLCCYFNQHAHCGCTDVGVYLLQGETVYSHNSFIFIEETTKLQCITDRRPCCMVVRLGQWYFPDGTRVPVIGMGATMATSFYRNRGNDGTVNLNRLNTNVDMPTGLFCCEVSDAAHDSNQTLCINIGKFI
jgi:hypothetical protein